MNGQVKIKIGPLELEGILHVPEKAQGIVLFAHGSGSGRLSPRNQFVAKKLQEQNLATLLIDLLTKEEERVDEITHKLRFDINLLAERLIGCTKWLKQEPLAKNLSICYFGASTGASAALQAAATVGSQVKAVVSRGGRPDLAGAYLSKVVSPTLLIVGGNDYGVIELNEEAFILLQCEKKLEIIPGATHLFEESGALEEVSRLAVHWFSSHL